MEGTGLGTQAREYGDFFLGCFIKMGPVYSSERPKALTFGDIAFDNASKISIQNNKENGGK